MKGDLGRFTAQAYVAQGLEIYVHSIKVIESVKGAYRLQPNVCTGTNSATGSQGS